jgi:hypothetical protein
MKYTCLIRTGLIALIDMKVCHCDKATFPYCTQTTLGSMEMVSHLDVAAPDLL